MRRRFPFDVRRSRLFEKLEGRIEEVMREELGNISKENRRKLERMKKDVMRWAEEEREFEIKERNFLEDPDSMGTCIIAGDEGDIMSYDEFVNEFLTELFTCIEEICVYYPLDLADVKGYYNIEVELDLAVKEIPDEATAREVVRKKIPAFDYRIRGNRLRVDFRTYYLGGSFGPVKEWIVVERL
jgi:hypothetical protein